MSQNIYGGYVDDSSVEMKGSNLHFGLNQKCKLVKHEFSKDTDDKEFSEFTFSINGTEINYRLYPITEVKDKDETITDPNHEAFKKALQDLGARVTSIFKCFTSEQAIATALQGMKNITFKDYIMAHLKLINPTEARQVELDIFLNYRYTPDAEGRKYLEIPKTRKHGAFICRHLPGQFEEVRDSEGLRYMDKTTGKLHLFTRNAWFMGSEYAKGSSTNTPSGISNLVTSAPGNPMANPFNTPPQQPAIDSDTFPPTGLGW